MPEVVTPFYGTNATVFEWEENKEAYGLAMKQRVERIYGEPTDSTEEERNG